MGFKELHSTERLSREVMHLTKEAKMSGSHAAIAAAHAAKKKREEEERMTTYHQEELDGYWEFKIVRSHTSAFGNPEKFYRVVEEEAIAGWELLEKLDDGRIRFKRRTELRKQDSMLPAGIDPYRTRYGISEGGLGALIALGVLAALGIVLLIVYLVQGSL